MTQAGKNMASGLLSVIGAIGVTLGLFGLLPALLQAIPDMKPLDEPLAMVEISRFEPKKSPAPKSQPRQEQRQDAEQAAPNPEPAPQAPAVLALTSLSLEIDPAMPSLPMGAAPAPVQSISISAPAPEPASAAPSVGAAGLYQAGDLDGPLVPVGNAKPLYPMKAKRRKIQGVVTVEFIVGLDGRVEELKIVDYAPPEIAGIFDQSVIQGVSTWRFAPGTAEGRPVRSLARAPIEFVLE